MGERGSTVLVLGFGPFLDVADNPAARLARAVDGREAGRLLVVGRELPVSYARSLEQTRSLVAEHHPVAVLCVGVARGRAAAAVECLAKNTAQGIDIDGRCPTTLIAGGPASLPASSAAHALATALEVAESSDAGQYVCNAWLYRVQWESQRAAWGRPPLPVAFLHIPDQGFAPNRLLAGLALGWDNFCVPGTLS